MPPEHRLYLHRYEKSQSVVSALDPVADVVTWIKGLRSQDYLGDIIRTEHRTLTATGQDLRARIAACSAHISVACQHLEVGLSGSEDVSFLSLYYSFLNLAKVYVLLGPQSPKLVGQRTHGAHTPG